MPVGTESGAGVGDRGRDDAAREGKRKQNKTAWAGQHAVRAAALATRSKGHKRGLVPLKGDISAECEQCGTAMQNRSTRTERAGASGERPSTHKMGIGRGVVHGGAAGWGACGWRHAPVHVLASLAAHQTRG